MAAAQTASVLANAPIYVTPVVTQTPLRVAAPGTTLQVLDDQGEWAKIAYNDPQWGRRIGWVQRSTIRIKDEALQPMDLSVSNGPRLHRLRFNQSTGRPKPGMAYPTTETAIGWSYLHISDPAERELRVGMERIFRRQSHPMAWHRGRRDGELQTELLDVEDVDGMFTRSWADPAFLSDPRWSCLSGSSWWV